MIVMVIFLAGVVVVLLGLAVLTAFDELSAPAPVPYEDVATPYVEGLQAAFRIQQAAWEAEQQIYTEMLRHGGHEVERP